MSYVPPQLFYENLCHGQTKAKNECDERHKQDKPGPKLKYGRRERRKQRIIDALLHSFSQQASEAGWRRK